MNRRTRGIGYLILACAAVVQFVVLPVRQRNARMARQALRLREEIGQLRQENGRLNEEIEALKSDPYYVEYLLRTRLRYRGPDEAPPGQGTR